MVGSDRIRSRRRACRVLLIAGVTIASLLVPGVARAAACLTVSADTTLSSDITDCADNGIEVTKSGVTINLNGHTIDGDDDAEDVGILIDGKSGVKIVGPGTITQFGTGIRANDANKTKVTGTTVTANNDEIGGIIVTQSLPEPGTSEGTVIDGNTVTDNAGSGIVVYRSSKVSKIRDNTVEDNGGDGIFLGGAGESNDLDGDGVDPDDFSYKVTEALISGNTVDDNFGTGIAIDATGKLNEDTDDDGGGGRDNIVDDNTVTDNGLASAAPGAGHEGGRSDNDFGGSGIKIAGKLKNTTISNNTASTNGNPGVVDCFRRNGAGILVVGGHKVVNITDNTANGNSMSGVFVAGHNKSVKIANNTFNDNVENCDNGNAGAKITGVHNKTKVTGNTLTGNDASGIQFTGHNKGTVIKNNTVTANDGAGASCCSDNFATAAIQLKGRSVSPDIIGNTASSQTDTSAIGHGIAIEGSFLEVLLQDNTANNNEGTGINVWGQGSKPKGIDKDPTPESFDDCDPDPGGGFQNCEDKNINDVANVKLIGNTTSSNLDDGVSLITDATLKNNTADNNTDFGFFFEDDATARGGDAEDGPHELKDAGGNSASGNNGTNCSPEVNCT